MSEVTKHPAVSMSEANRASFDPWTATFEEANGLQESWTGLRGGPLFQHVAAQTVLAMRVRVEAGDGGAVLAAVAQCALEDLVMPEWLAREYLRRWRLVTFAHVASWDEAFDRPWPKGKKSSHLARERHRWLARFKVFNLVTTFVKMHPNLPLDPEWERIAREAGVSTTLAQDLYYKQPPVTGMTPGDIRERMGWPRVPAKNRKLGGVPGKKRKLAGRQRKG
jgi:hypothetical protein